MPPLLAPAVATLVALVRGTASNATWLATACEAAFETAATDAAEPDPAPPERVPQPPPAGPGRT